MWPFTRGSDQLASFSREGGSPPSDFETLTIARDGAFSLWRTVGRTSPIGRFTGDLPAATLATLRAAIDLNRSGQSTSMSHVPDVSIDKVVIGRRTFALSDDQSAPAPWTAIVDQLRGLLEELTNSPRAAIALKFDGRTAFLCHLGDTPLELDLSQGALVRLVSWVDGVAVGEQRLPLAGPRSVTASAGWTYPVQLPDVPTGDVSAHVENLVAFDGVAWHGCAIDSPQHRN